MFDFNDIKKAGKVLSGVVKKTPLQRIERLSEKFQAEVFFKREDLQPIRSYKLRGAYFKISCLSDGEKRKGVVCASAGNHAQGVAFACFQNKIKGVVFMPSTTPAQKVERVKYFGKEFVKIRLEGDEFSQAYEIAEDFCRKNNMIFIHPFDDPLVVAGQGTIGIEIFEDLPDVDYVFVPVGGGGLLAGVSVALKSLRPEVKIFGVEPEGADSLYQSLKVGSRVCLPKVDNFVDGVAVKQVGEIGFEIAKRFVDDVFVSPEGKVAQTMIDLYQAEGIIAEPAGSLAVSILDSASEMIRGKRVVCIISGGNNDLLRYPEILERSLVYQGKKRYFLIEFYQKPGQLKRFVNNVLGADDDIVFFEYVKKNNKEKGPALVGIEFRRKKDADLMIDRLRKYGFKYKELTQEDMSYYLLI